MNVDNKFGKGGDFALLLSAVIKNESSFGAGLPAVLFWPINRLMPFMLPIRGTLLADFMKNEGLCDAKTR
ncbi:hypothetical protein M2105_004771 [Paenibacillus sp. PastF-1]|nr:hypothetical protein [Paenibacillus sp. PastF-2]MDF9850402.1 hypothetical protein [Paenibacillus sp. PastM-2]MDF9856895.1 hypothetical protein [Paenibacillus sp. PastF-1]MDH6482248.1 hypothetical protein [Paenibacillus sp. PastH-2]MDH6509588.1 hypothetical protein [Paenibacillus sp. PastM-3]